MQFEVVRDAQRLATLADEWRPLRPDAPMQSPEWLSAWWECYQDGSRELFVVAVRDGGQLVGVAPWYRDTRRGRTAIRWLGDGRVCTDHATLLTTPAWEDSQRLALAGALADWLLTDCNERWHELKLESTDADDAVCQRLIAALTAAGCHRLQTEQPGSCFVDLPATFDEYLMTVSKNHRKRCRRWDKQFFDTGRARVTVATTPDACLASWQTLVDLHNTRRTNLGEQGAFEDARFAAFHRRAIPRLAEANAVQLRVLEIDGQPAAAEYVLQDGHAWYAYQSGMTEAGEALSAGSLSILSMVKEAIAAGRTRLDLLRGDEPYKFSWAAQHRPAATITLRRNTRAGQLITACDRAWRSVKRAKRLVR